MPATDVYRAGSTALITGGASGIGLALARHCVSVGMRVLIVDRDDASLEAAGAEFRSAVADSTVIVHKADVSKSVEWIGIKEKMENKMGSLELLVLNAGMGGSGGWTEESYFRDIMETNLFSVINGINTMLPHVHTSAKSTPTSIIITGSKQGITNPPGNPAYNASKAAVKTLAEHLSWDLRDKSTSVHLLVPGWTYTKLTGSQPGKEKPAGAWTPEQVVEHLLKKMGEDKFYVICPDNDVSEETDKKRMMWSVGDIVHERQPLSRWRDEYKEEAKEAMDKMHV